MNRELLEKPFEPAQIRQRKGRNGLLDYIERHNVVHRLNEALDGAWSFEITHHEGARGRGARPRQADGRRHHQDELVRPVKADASSGSQSRRGKSQTPRSLDGRGEGNRTSEAHRQSHQKDGERVTGP